MVDEFAGSMCIKQRSSPTTKISISWKPPVAGQFAVNIDDFWREGKVALAIIIRKRTYGFSILGSFCMDSLSTDMAQLFALNWASWLIEAKRQEALGWRYDALGVVNQVMDVEE